ncbi:hypothetical protein ABZ568_32345 [Streptomyces olindensis]|uniref:Uncharacterized protein n=1 Tax=Streptomyces olindensis TaxID=358823 RepID=A0ABV2Y442_9ACTN
MSDDQHKADLGRVSHQNSFADIARNVEEPEGNGLLARLVSDPLRAVVGATAPGKAVFGSTDFDAKNLDLNEMIDLVDQTDPEDLESSGKALWDARDAVKAAADELDGRINKLRWIGQAGTAFRDWGSSLVASTHDLSDFAGKAGDQITAAAVGLASVRRAMPARDPHNRKRPESFTDAEKAADKGEYDAAVKVEKDRQEAINQMNRLASYYAVSSQQLQVLQEKPPTFRPMPDVGVPLPRRTEGSGSSGSASVSDGSAASTGRYTPTESAGRGGVPGSSDTPVPSTPVGTVAYPEDSVRTNIDSVGTLPPATTTTATGHTPPATGTHPTVGGQTGMFDSHGTPVPNRVSGRTAGGSNGLRAPASAQGRTQPGLTNSGTGRATGSGSTSQTGRPTPTGQPAGRATGSTAKSSSMGHGVTGGTPRVGGTAAPRATTGPATGAGRANGVVGGRPTTAGGVPAKGGARVPRGTVIGAGPKAMPQPLTGGPGQRGVVGTPPAGGRPGGGTGGAAREGTGGSKPVTGNPSARNSAAQAERNGMTRGGTGLVRVPVDKGKPGEGRNAPGTPCPDYLGDNGEPGPPDKPRRDVPPVAN